MQREASWGHAEGEQGAEPGGMSERRLASPQRRRRPWPPTAGTSATTARLPCRQSTPHSFGGHRALRFDLLVMGAGISCARTTTV